MALHGRRPLWLCMAIFVVETMLKLTRKFVQEHFVSGVPCSFVMLQLAEDTDRYHGYLAAVWFLRVAGIVTQGALAGRLARRIRSQKALPVVEEPGLDRLVEMLHCCYGVVFVQVLVSVLIVFLNAFRATPFSLILGLECLLVRQRLLGDRQTPESSLMSANADATRRAGTVSREAINSLPTAMKDKRVIDDLSALVWYLHCKRHPLLPAVCAYQTDGSCGLPGHWFLSAEQLLQHALCDNDSSHRRTIYPVGHCNQLDVDQEMALDALARYAKSRDSHVCDSIVGNGWGFAELGRIVTTHTSMGCRERAAMILCHLLNIHARERLAGISDPYDPFLGGHVTLLRQMGLDMVSALASNASPQLQENVARTLWSLSQRCTIAECLFHGEEGKSLIEELVKIAVGGGLTDTVNVYTLLVFVELLRHHVPYAHSVWLEKVQTFAQLAADASLEWETPRREAFYGVHFGDSDLEGESSWIVPPHGAFRQSTALPVIIDFALSHRSSMECKSTLALIFLSYHRLGSHHLFPFEVAELTRLFQIRFNQTFQGE
ncbi:hypothetical protein CBR_g52160 [Chara braunii]|uniref:DUF4220 domain-containing protein n=1 Tax=Chara braunii TaxID=69332 RepID=A0A388M9T1_CHABU|nr:hypothetical protein CBR_g52160 [Chara braunii]|eukprot:GBG91275.1 hypothetical protein CBR_g52160 [Chara braunii]